MILPDVQITEKHWKVGDSIKFPGTNVPPVQIGQIAVLDLGGGQYQTHFYTRTGELILHLALEGKVMPNN